MKITVRSAAKKRLDKIHKVGHWHKKFIIFPRTVKSEKGYKEIVFLTTVYRKAVFRLMTGSDYGHYHEPIYKYRVDDDAFVDILGKGDKLEFDSVEAQHAYRKLKEKCNE